MPLQQSRRRLTPASGRSLTPHLDLDRVLVLGPAPAGLVLVRRGDRVELMGPPRLVVLGLPRLQAPVELVLVGQGDRVELMGPPRLVVLGLPRLQAPVELVLVGQGDRVELMGPPRPVGLAAPRLVGRVAMGPVALARLVDPARRVAPVDRVPVMSRVDLVDRAGPAVLAPVGRAVLVAPAVPDLTGRADPVDRHRRRTSNTVSMTGVAPRWAAPGTCHTDSARRITVHRLRRGNTGSAGTVGLPPGLRRHSGTDRRPPVAGAVLRLPVVGTAHGTVRRAMSQSRSVISGRLVTTGSTRSRCSTRCSVDGASGSSVSGSRCTDLTAVSRDYLSSSTH